MARTSKSTAVSTNALSDNTTTPPDARQLAIFPPDKVIEAAKSRLRTAMVEQNDGQPVPEIVETALERSVQWHEGQYRKSGEPYVVHPIEVAILLSRMSADTESIAAALLHMRHDHADDPCDANEISNEIENVDDQRRRRI